MTAYGGYGGTVWKMDEEELCPKDRPLFVRLGTYVILD
jgi:hypothetical protein